MDHKSLANKLILFDSSPSHDTDSKLILQEILRIRLKQIDDLEAMCLKNIDMSDSTLKTQIIETSNILLEMRKKDIEVLNDLNNLPNMNTLHRYINLLSNQRKIEATQILKLTKCIE